MKLILNEDEISHLNVIKSLISSSNEMFISVAFMKSKGMNTLLSDFKNALENNCKLTIFVGTEFYLTEPNALRTIHRLFKKYRKSRLFIFKQNSKNMFHPKVYCFIAKTKMTIISGSANLTQGGLLNNIEISILVESDLKIVFRKKLFPYLGNSKRVKKSNSRVNY